MCQPTSKLPVTTRKMVLAGRVTEGGLSFWVKNKVTKDTRGKDYGDQPTWTLERYSFVYWLCTLGQLLTTPNISSLICQTVVVMPAS